MKVSVFVLVLALTGCADNHPSPLGDATITCYSGGTVIFQDAIDGDVSFIQSSMVFRSKKTGGEGYVSGSCIAQY